MAWPVGDAAVGNRRLLLCSAEAIQCSRSRKQRRLVGCVCAELLTCIIVPLKPEVNEVVMMLRLCTCMMLKAPMQMDKVTGIGLLCTI